jgi:hypothetical protein
MTRKTRHKASLAQPLGPKVGSREWLRKLHPVSSFDPVVGSTDWKDLRANRDQARAWINEHARPRGPRIYIADAADEHDGDHPAFDYCDGHEEAED